MTNPTNPEAAEALEQWLSQFGDEEQERICRYALDHVVPRLRASHTPPAVSAEPVAWRYQDGNGRFRYRGHVPGFDVEYALLKPIALYTHHAPQPQPSKAGAQMREAARSVPPAGAEADAALVKAYAEGRADEREDNMRLLTWAYRKLMHVSFSKQEDALALDEIKLMMEGAA